MAWVPYPLLSALPMALALWQFEHDIHGTAFIYEFVYVVLWLGNLLILAGLLDCHQVPWQFLSSRWTMAPWLPLLQVAVLISWTRCSRLWVLLLIGGCLMEVSQVLWADVCGRGVQMRIFFPNPEDVGPIPCHWPCEGAPCLLVFADSARIAGSALRVAWMIDQIGRLWG